MMYLMVIRICLDIRLPIRRFSMTYQIFRLGILRRVLEY